MPERDNPFSHPIVLIDMAHTAESATATHTSATKQQEESTSAILVCVSHSQLRGHSRSRECHTINCASVGESHFPPDCIWGSLTLTAALIEHGEKSSFRDFAGAHSPLVSRQMKFAIIT